MHYPVTDQDIAEVRAANPGHKEINYPYDVWSLDLRNQVRDVYLARIQNENTIQLEQ